MGGYLNRWNRGPWRILNYLLSKNRLGPSYERTLSDQYFGSNGKIRFFHKFVWEVVENEKIQGFHVWRNISCQKIMMVITIMMVIKPTKSSFQGGCQRLFKSSCQRCRTYGPIALDSWAAMEKLSRGEEAKMDRRVRWTSLITFSFGNVITSDFQLLLLLVKVFDASTVKKYLRLLPPQHTILVFWSRKFFCIFF